MEQIRRYTIDKDRMEVTIYGRICRVKIRRLDGVVPGNVWGRLHISMRLPKTGICSVYAYAGEEPILTEEEEQRLWEREQRLGTNQEDFLLSDLKGRYLWIAMELSGANIRHIFNLYVEQGGEIFLSQFPEVYREGGEFFQRYLSVFSTLYTELDRKITEAPGLLDISETPGRFLNLYMEWLGRFQKGTYLPQQMKRKLLRELYWLNRRKGTKKALLKITEIVLGKEALIREEEKWEIIVLVRERIQQETERILLSLLEEYKPLRSTIRLVYYGGPPILGEALHLDMGCALVGWPKARLDGEMRLGQCRISAERR